MVMFLAVGGGEAAPPDEMPRVASRSNTASRPSASVPGTVGQLESIAKAKRMIAECQSTLDGVKDYTCTFHKRERINGRVTSPHVMVLKARSSPQSFYFKYQRPRTGREAIYVAGRNKGKVLAHDVGLGKLLAGTLHLDPLGSMAMDDNLHPITEAGLAHLIKTVSDRWAAELKPEDSVIRFHPSMQIGPRVCTMIESVHPEKRPSFMFHMVRVYVDHELGLPIRFESYDWPKRPGAAPELVEEYTYVDLKINVGLTDLDFDPANTAYAFGRF